jgi:predicted alpha/beta-fold hydrolase
MTVVPRFGFRDTEDYYAQASVGPRLGRLKRPALLVAGENDPMVPPSAIRPHLRGSEVRGLTVRWLRSGGHLAFPRNVDLGLKGESDGRSGADYVSQVLLWLQEIASTGG